MGYQTRGKKKKQKKTCLFALKRVRVGGYRHQRGSGSRWLDSFFSLGHTYSPPHTHTHIKPIWLHPATVWGWLNGGSGHFWPAFEMDSLCSLSVYLMLWKILGDEVLILRQHLPHWIKEGCWVDTDDSMKVVEVLCIFLPWPLFTHIDNSR